MPRAEIAGTTIHYLDVGSGPVALFLHGFPLDATMWHDQLERLADIRRCVAPDLRGFGRSGPVTSDVLTMERHAADVAALMESLGIHAADVIALSMGGYVALALAQLHATRLRTLSLIDTRAEADTAEGKVEREEVARRVLAHGRRSFAEGLLPALVAPGASPHVRARLFTMMEGTAYETIVAALAGMAERPDRTPILRRVEVPTAVVVGEYDAITPPASAESMAHATPRASLHVVPGVGHMSPMEAPDTVAAILRTHLTTAGSAGH